MANRQSFLSQHTMIDTAPMPENIPKVQEIGTTSAPLLSASFFIGARCRPFNDDYMQCKTEANGRGELDCMKEGRKVTRCASSVIRDVNTHCLAQFRDHWHCLENNNHQLFQCRRWERKLNKCVFENIGLEKTLPGAPPDDVPVHMRKKQIYATLPQDDPEERFYWRWTEQLWGLEHKKRERLEREANAKATSAGPAGPQGEPATLT